jgi:hypothetical protein
MRLIRLLLCLTVTFVPSFVQGSSYQWRDNQGVTHFTDNPDSVPERYLNAAREIPSLAAEPKQKQATVVPAASGDGASAVAVSAGQKSDASQESAADKLCKELKSLRQGIAVKTDQLAQLRHRWAVVKGRTPSPQELKDFAAKQAKGKVTPEDNPYVNKSSLSVSAPARTAYYKKLQEIQGDQERLREL